jgi:6,7-dimethyl-8-ribityllumazine synthase
LSPLGVAATVTHQLAIVTTQYNEPVTEPMTDLAAQAAEERGAEVVETASVPGVYDTPLAADRLAARDDVDAVVVVGAVVTGDTDHDQVVVQTAGEALTEISREYDKPVTFGVSGPGMTPEEAADRVDKGAGAVNAAVDMLDNLPERA